MKQKIIWCAAFAILVMNCSLQAQQRWWSDEIEDRLVKSESNRPEIQKALLDITVSQRKGMEFLIENMPLTDLKSLKADFLLSNTILAYKARAELPWGKDIPEQIFLNDVLPYANVDEKRDEWRKEFYELCMPIAKGCKTPSEAAQKINSQIFGKLKLGYSTQRKAANQSPKESIEQGKASCTGLSIVLSDACRSVAIPARLVGTPLWANKRGNHTWVEIWDKDWHFTGACEQDPTGLDRGWFVGDASQAKKDSFEHAIYAASFQKTKIHFPLVWATRNKDVPAENVTDRYAKKPASKTDTVRVMIRVTDNSKKRVAIAIKLSLKDDPKSQLDGISKGESADTNDFLTFELKPQQDYVIYFGDQQKMLRTELAGKQQIIDFILNSKK